MAGPMLPKSAYVVEYVAIDSNQVALVTTDFNQQPEPVVGFHVFGVDSCPSCRHSTCGAFALEIVATSASDSLGQKAATFAKGVVGGVVLNRLRTFGLGIGYGPTAAITPALPAGARSAVITCACTTNHEAPQGKETTKPDGALGCGSYWMIAATRDTNSPSGMTLSVVPSTVAYRALAANKDISTSVAGSLTTVQANAGKWQTVMTALLGLLAVSSVVGGRDTLSKLSPFAQASIGVLAVVAIVANIWAIYRFTLAASGRTDMVSVGTVGDVEQADLDPLRRARTAIQAFDNALIATAVALLAALATLLFVWFAPDASAPSKIKITLTDHDATLCGAVTVDSATGILTIKPGPDGAQTKSYSLSEVKSIANC